MGTFDVLQLFLLFLSLGDVHISLSISVCGGFPKLGGAFLGVPIIRTIVYLGLYWGPLI